MAINLDDEIFNKASDKAMQEALEKTQEERLKVMDLSQFSLIVKELKKSSIDKTLIEKLENDIDMATNKNQIVIDTIKKGGVVAEGLLKVLKKILV